MWMVLPVSFPHPSHTGQQYHSFSTSFFSSPLKHKQWLGYEEFRVWLDCSFFQFSLLLVQIIITSYLPLSDLLVTSFSLFQILASISPSLNVYINLTLSPPWWWNLLPPFYCLPYPHTWYALLLTISTYLKCVSSLILTKASIFIKHFFFKLLQYLKCTLLVTLHRLPITMVTGIFKPLSGHKLYLIYIVSNLMLYV